MSKQPPPAPTTSAVGPCPTVIQIVALKVYPAPSHHATTPHNNKREFMRRRSGQKVVCFYEAQRKSADSSSFFAAVCRNIYIDRVQQKKYAVENI